MVDENLTLAQSTLKHRLEELDEDTLPHIKMGFTMLARISNEIRPNLIDYIISNFSDRKNIDMAAAAELAGLDKHTIVDVLSAVTLSVGAVVDLDVSSDDFVRFAENKLFEADQIAVAREVLSKVGESRSRLEEAMEQSSLANAVLPSFRSLSGEIDLRLKFDAEGIAKQSVPVAVLYISTDCDERVWLQASKSDLDRMIKNLQKLADNIEVASKLKVSL